MVGSGCRAGKRRGSPGSRVRNWAQKLSCSSSGWLASRWYHSGSALTRQPQRTPHGWGLANGIGLGDVRCGGRKPAPAV